MDKEDFYACHYGSRPYVLLNDKGFYFDEFNKDLENVCEYPSIDFLMSDFHVLVKEKKVIFLYPHQKEELEFVKNYLPIHTTPVFMNVISEKFLMSDYDEDKVLDLASKRDRYVYLSLFVFGRIYSEGLNPSYLYGDVVSMWDSLEVRKICEDLVKDFLNNEDYEPILFLELMVEKLLGKETIQSKNIKKLLSYPKGEEINIEEFDCDSLIEILMKYGVIYKPTKDTISRI